MGKGALGRDCGTSPDGDAASSTAERRVGRRPLEPEVLADAISDVLGVVQAYGDQPAGTRAVALIDATIPSVTLDILGRCGREGACETSSATIGSLPQKLHLFNGELLNARIAVDGSRLNELLVSDKEPLAIVDQFYRVALARRPTDEEQQHWRKQLEALAPEEHRALLEDFV